MPIGSEVTAAPPATTAELVRRCRDLLRRSELAAAKALAVEAEAADHGSAAALLIIAIVSRMQDDHAEALAFALRAADRGRGLGDLAAEACARGEIARVLVQTGDTDEALQEALAALELAETSADAQAVVTVLTAVGNVYLTLRQFDLAAEACERGAETALLIGDETAYGALQDTVACALLGTADAARAEHDEAGAVRAALAATERSRAAMLIARRIGHRRNEATALANLAEGLAFAGRPGDALQLLESWRIDPERDMAYTINHHLDTRGLIYLALGRHDEAIACFTEGLETAEGRNSAMVFCEHLAEAHEQRGDMAAALAAYKRFHRLFRQVVSETAQRNARVAEVRLETEQAKASAELERRRADGLQHTNVELSRHADDLLRRSLEDALTGLANRRRLDDRLAVGTAADAVMLLDVDHFKRVNDTFSHQVGDDVLRQLAELFRAACRTVDVAARYGGEEFAVLLHDTDAPDAEAAAERIRRTVEQFTWGRFAPGLAITVSVGVAAGGEAATPAGLLSIADKRLYEAKNAGRNRVVGPTPR